MKREVCFLLVFVVLCHVPGCGGDDDDNQKTVHIPRSIVSSELSADRAARARAEELLAQERRKTEQEHRAAAARLSQESRKRGLATVLAAVLSCFGAVAVFLLARERRLRLVATSALKWILDRRRDHG